MLIYQSILLAILAALLVNTLINLRVLRKPAKRPPPAAGPLVSILAPARNEARNIARCIESLAHQDYPSFEILVLDDHSEDDTAAIVAALAQRYPMVRLLRGKPLPSNWHGKAYACSQLAEAARGEWLLFVDADTIHDPACLSTTLRVAQEQQADLLTMLPHILTGSFSEALLLPLIPFVFGALLPMGLVMRASAPLLAGALGPFMLFRREMYQRIGGHEAVRADIVEDVQLSRLVKQRGGRLVWVDGAELMQVRFYHNLGEAWRGLGKSTFTALNYSVSSLLIGAAACAVLFFAPYGFLVDSALTRQFTAALLWLPLSQVLTTWLLRLLLAQRFHMSRSIVVLHAATMLMTLLIGLHAAYQAMFGKGVIWKGRAYQFQRQRAGIHLEPARLLATARLTLAGALTLLGLRWGNAALGVAAIVPLISWTCAMLSHALVRQPDLRLPAVADAAGGLGSLSYLLLSGFIGLWLALLVVLLVVGSARWLRWHGAATLGMVTAGSLLLLIAGASLPLIRTLVIGWVVGAALLARHSIIETVGGWFEHLRLP